MHSVQKILTVENIYGWTIPLQSSIIKESSIHIYFPRLEFSGSSVYTGCIKKKVIELWSALARPLYNLQKSFFRSRKDQAFSFRLLPCL